ncbi:MAG: hypothetical protein WDN06_20560 [Asticcacaulis sp.]
MSHPTLLSGLSEIAAHYDALLCDIWGVIHNGRQHFPPAYEALKKFKAERGPVVLISNSPRPRDDLIAQLASLGIMEDGFSDVVSSGDATREYLRKFAPQGPAWRIGPPRDDVLYAGIDIGFTSQPDAAAFISCSGPFDDENDTLDQYKPRLHHRGPAQAGDDLRQPGQGGAARRQDHHVRRLAGRSLRLARRAGDHGRQALPADL